MYGVHQGLVLDPILFSLYATPLSKDIGRCSFMKFNFYADDTQLFIHRTHKNVTQSFERLNRCLNDVKKWLSANMLKFNPDKTNFIIFGSKTHHVKLKSFLPVNILGNQLHPADVVKNLGTWFNSDFSFSGHVQSVYKFCFVQIRDLRRLRQYLTQEVAVKAANALVSSQLDYCNALFISLSGFNVRKLQNVQNSLARIVTNITKIFTYNSST